MTHNYQVIDFVCLLQGKSIVSVCELFVVDINYLILQHCF